MSRIEEALKKAAEARGSMSGAGRLREPPQAEFEDPVRHLPPPPAPAAGVAVTTDNPMLPTLSDPHSPLSEEYRKLKSTIVAGAKKGGFRNTILVTSALDGEGKSMTALNVAITLAQEYDHTVLLIDADLRKPSVAEYLGIPEERGLSDLLREGGELSDVLRATGIGRLSLLPAGTPVRNPVELLSSRRMKNLMAEIKNRYPDRFVIVDAPPVLPFAETRALSMMTDSAVLIVREGRSSLKLVREALDTLTKEKVIGLVYNEATIPSLCGSYGYYRNYRYGRMKQPDRTGLLSPQ